MRKVLASALPIILALALPAVAQDTGASVDATAVPSAETSATVSAEAGASAMGSSAVPATEGPLDAQITSDNSLASLIAAIMAGAAVDLSAVTDASQVAIVPVSSLRTDALAGDASLDEAISSQAEGLATLRSDVTVNEPISTKLTAEGYVPGDVVAIRTDASGNTQVYVDDRR